MPRISNKQKKVLDLLYEAIIEEKEEAIDKCRVIYKSPKKDKGSPKKPKLKPKKK